MKKPIAAIFNDVHLRQENEKAILRAVTGMINHVKKNKINTIFLAGDLFHSRSHQRQSELNTFDKILKNFYEAGLEVIAIPGNHDKNRYDLQESFLDSFKYHPGFTLISEPKLIEVGGVSIEMIPFFSDNILVPMLKNTKGGDILISHFEMNGSINNGHVSSDKNISKRHLKKWKKTYLGHFHNHVEITEDIVHLPSFIQNNFGEDSNKGFTIIYDDLSYEIVKSDFKEYIKIPIDIDTITSKEIKSLIQEHSDSENVIRFEFYGAESKLKAIDKTQFENTGIDVKIKFDKKFEIEDGPEPINIKKFDKNQVYNLFKDFCKDKNLNYNEGIVLLNNFFDND